MRIDWTELLRHYLQVLAFALAISAILYALAPEHPYEHQLVYSLCIATVNWLIIDVGRFALNPNPETGWPQGWRWLLLVAVGILGGWTGGTWLADHWFGWSSWDKTPSKLRNDWIITLVAGTVASYFFYSRGKSSYLVAKFAEAQRDTAEAKRQAAEAQLKLLQAQLDPHMLFNTLANLRVLIGLQPEAAQAMLDRMIAFLRATLSASRATTHPLSAEFERLRDYLELMAMRMGPRLTFTLALPDDLRDVPVPTLLLQPLVENSIKHGLEPKVQGGHVTVRASRVNSPFGAALQLDIIDTGMGLHEAESTHHGFGLTQVRERLATAYGEHATLNLIANNREGTGAIIIFPSPSLPESRPSHAMAP
jgi:Histidine kinase